MSEHVAAIRQVRPTDCKALTTFLQENNRPEIVRHFHPFPLTAESAVEIACVEHLDRFYLALLNAQVVGLCMLRGWDEGFEVPSFGVLVDYRYQGQGLGRRMTEFAIGEARKLNCRTVRLSVYASNARAAHLYEALSFRVQHREPSVVAGKADETIVMIKEL